MRLEYDRETKNFRAELRSWLESNLPDADETRRDPVLSTGHLPDWAQAWQKRQFDAGWLVPGWPPELGGRNATPIQQLVYFEEFAKMPLPRSYNVQGLTIIVPSIVDYGTPAQKAQYALPSLRGELTWCLGMSEPGAGSDLASLTTSAVQDGDAFIVNGQKVWTSGAQHADLCLCFVRTDPEVPKHGGISVLIIDMKTPGIDVRPLPELTNRDYADFNEVFFNDVKVPKENLLGELNRGWAISAGSLAHERGMLWTVQASRIEHKLNDLREMADRPGPGGEPLRNNARFRDDYAALYIDSQALKYMGYRGFTKVARGEASPEHSVFKLMASEVEQRLTQTAMEYLGAEALEVTGEHRMVAGIDYEQPWAFQYLHSFSNTIAGGTSEIQRNIIAQRVLGLPRR